MSNRLTKRISLYKDNTKKIEGKDGKYYYFLNFKYDENGNRLPLGTRYSTIIKESRLTTKQPVNEAMIRFWIANDDEFTIITSVKNEDGTYTKGKLDHTILGFELSKMIYPREKKKKEKNEVEMNNPEIKSEDNKVKDEEMDM